MTLTLLCVLKIDKYRPNNIRTNAMLDMTFTSSGGKKSWNQIVRFYPIYNGEIKGEISKEGL